MLRALAVTEPTAQEWITKLKKVTSKDHIIPYLMAILISRL